MQEKELYDYFYNYRFKESKNQWRSFTYGSFLYDCLIEDRVDYNSCIYDELENYTLSLFNYNEELKERLTRKAIAELLDLSELQEIAENFIFWHDD